MVTSIPLFDRSYRSHKNLWFYGFGLGETMGKHSIICSPYIPDISNIGLSSIVFWNTPHMYLHYSKSMKLHHRPPCSFAWAAKVMNYAFSSRHTVKSGGEGFFRCPSQIQEFYIHLKNLITYNLGRFSVYSKSGWVRRFRGLQTYQSLGRINSESSACGCSFISNIALL